MDHETCLAYLVAGGLAAAAAAQPPGLAEFRIDTEDDPTVFVQMGGLDVGPGGDFVTVLDTSEPRILVRRYTSGGEPAGDELAIETGDGSRYVSPVVASLGDGFVVVWERLEADARDVVGQRFTSLGEPAGEVFPVHAAAADGQFDPDVASDHEGGFVVTWLKAEGNIDGTFFARRFSSTGVPATGDLAVAEVGEFARGNTAVASDADGDFVVVWLYAPGGGFYNNETHFLRYSSTGEPLSAELRVSRDDGHWSPAVASEPDGDFVVVWSRPFAAADDEMFVRRFSASGEPLTDEIRVAEYATWPRVATDADGNFLVVWGKGKADLGRHFSAAGEPQGGQFRVNQVAGFLDNVTVAGDLTGNFVVGWDRGGRAFARRLPLDGRAGALHFSPEPDGPVVPGMIEFGAIEDDRVVTVAGVVRTGGALGEVSVDYSTEPGSAEPGEDYLTAAGSFVFGEDGPQMQTFGVEILEDEEIEADEVFTVRLVNPRGGAQLIDASTARVGIFADEFNPPEAGPVPLGPERVVNTRRQGHQFFPQVAVSPEGEFIVVWESVGEGIFAQLFDRDAAPRRQEFRVHGSPPADQRRPSVAFDNRGDFLVVWQSSPDDGTSVFQGRHFSGNGEPRGNDFGIARADGCRPDFPSECSFAGPGRVAAGIDGRFPAAWGRVRQTRFTVATQVKAGFVGPGAEATELLLLAVTENGLSPGIAARRDGGFVVAWSPDFQRRLTGRRFDRSGRPAEQVFEIAYEGAGAVMGFGLALADDGRVTAGWNKAQDVVVRTFGRNGRPLTEPVPVPQFSLGRFSDPALGADPAGNVIAVWAQADLDRGFEQDGSGSGLFARRFAAAGTPAGGEFPVNLTTALDQRSPAVAVGRDGRFMVAWEHEDLSSGGSDIMARAFAPEGCVAHAGSLCFQDGRFQVEVEWRDFGGTPGAGRGAVVAGSGSTGGVALASRDSAVVEFFGPDNWEMLVKVLDGRGLNGHFWLFLAAATNVPYQVAVTDTSCGEVRTYENSAGRAAPAVTDTEAFAGCAVPQPPSCVGDEDTLCLGEGGRFRVEIAWQDFAGNSGTARQVSLAGAGPAQNDDSGLFYFFSEENWEMLVKVLDGCAVNGHYWVFAATATDVEYTLRVTDTASNRLRTYVNPLRTDADAVTDTRAFDACPLDAKRLPPSRKPPVVSSSSYD